MRICQLNPYYFPYAGGIERRIRELGRRLARRHEVYVLTSQMPGTPLEETQDGMQIHRLPSRYWFREVWNPPVVRTPHLLEAMRRIRPDVVDYHYRWAPAYARAFRSANAFSRLVFTYHNTYGEGTGVLRWASLANDWWTRRFIRRSDRIVCISPFIRDDLARRGFPEDRLTVVPNGVDADALRDEAKTGDLPRGLPPTFVAAVGRLVPTKGFDLLVHALTELPSHVHAVVCGEGPQRVPLERLAERLGVRSRLHLLGWVPEATKLRILQQALACVHPARFESFGISVLEAMAAGAPVVAARVGGLPDLVGVAGILIPPEDPHSLAESVGSLLADESLRRRRSDASRRQAKHFDWDAAARALERLYDEVLQSPLVPNPSPAAAPAAGAT